MASGRTLFFAALIFGATIYFLLSSRTSPLSSPSPPLKSPTVLVDEIPAIGLGTWQSEKSKVADAVKWALDAGYRHIDAAAAYNNQEQVGEGIKAAGLNRSDYWVTSKLWNTAHRPEDVRPALEKTLSELGLDYLDLYLMHWPVAMNPSTNKLEKNTTYTKTWAAMEELVRANLTRYIGISNFARHEVQTLLDNSTIKPYAHEFETHPYLQQQDFVGWHAELGIKVIAYSPFANVNPIYDSGVPSILKDPVFVNAAKTKGCTPAQFILAWGLKRGTIVIPKSVHEERIVENFEALEVDLTDAELKTLAKVDRKLRMNNPSKNWGYDLFSDLDGA